ncbi:hypothetical protein E3N88_44837 [Mikania micrantha]|uniref:Protein kinase domain-containing protein n=1 Tax=Mikania micrantha TaxID=192012 RepID=A0A5N6LD76_9ASTR|nr:hypothetical protein E3N88_44837 [Mikania micrantha]
MQQIRLLAFSLSFESRCRRVLVHSELKEEDINLFLIPVEGSIMVFKFRCLSIGDVAQETESDDEFVTAPSRFGLSLGSATTSRNVDYISSGVPSLNGGSSTLRVFTLAELNKATDNFDQSTKIGEGGFGSVHVVGTKGYAAPEYVQTGRLTSKIDVWSYGIFLEELITGRLPVTQKNPEIDHACMRWVCCYMGTGKSKLAVDPRLNDKYSVRSMEKISFIAGKCLDKNPKLRPTMNEVLEMVNQAIALESHFFS